MPNIHAPLPETQQNIFRPVVLDIVRQIQKLTQMKEATIYFPDDPTGKIATNTGTIDSKSQDRFATLSNKRRNTIRVEEEADKDEMSPTFFNGQEYPGIFEDRLLNVKLSPVYAKHNVKIEIEYTCESKTEAERWYQDIRMKLSRLSDINMHKAQYHYNIHSKMFDIVAKVYELRESQAPYGETLDQYIHSHSTDRLTIVSDLVNKKRIFAVSETQIEITGIYEFDGIPQKAEKEKESGTWTISFEYRFNYDKPIGAHLRYPVIVHNKTMPLEWVNFTSEETRAIASAPTASSRSQSAFRMFRADEVMDRVKSRDGIIRLPRFDDFKSTVDLRSSAGVLQALACLSPDDKKTVLSLQDLDDVVLDDDVIAFMKTEYLYLAQPYKSIFNISLYQNNNLQDYRRLEVDQNLVVKSTEDLDIRKQYRVRLSVITDIDLLDNSVIPRLRLYPQVLNKILRAINQAFRENPEMNNLGITRRMNGQEFTFIYRALLGKESAFTSTIGWDSSNTLTKFGLTRRFLDQVKYQYRRQFTTMIFGTLAYPKVDPNLQQAHVGNLVVTSDQPPTTNY